MPHLGAELLFLIILINKLKNQIERSMFLNQQTYFLRICSTENIWRDKVLVVEYPIVAKSRKQEKVGELTLP